MAKVILISQFPLPYSKIGSWSTMYKNYLERDHLIDLIICEKPEERFASVDYVIVENDLITKLRRKWHKYYRLGYLDALKTVLRKDEKYVIQVIDNYKIVFKIDEILKQMGIRQNCYIQCFYHGFAPFLAEENVKGFYGLIDELVLLTKDAYKAHTQYYSTFPCKASVLHNGIDTQKFHKPDAVLKEKLKAELGYAGKKVFVWCSQDRPKKGLHMILDAWKRIYPNHEDIVLLVIGAKKMADVDGVIFLGKIPNPDLPKYYQAADCYVFPTLWHEGFGLSLIEALNCGCYCIASKLGGVPEVLQYGKLGKLIENPNFVSEWVTAIEDYLSGKDQPILIGEPIYTLEQWIANMNAVILEAKKSLT
jgi:glycosyltransferase involved in cell wall biosynthesis